MISFYGYIRNKFLSKYVIVDTCDLKQYSGKLEKMLSDGILVSPKGKKTPFAIPINKILCIQEVEK